MDLATTIREIMPNVAITTDIIIGFPTETDADFQDTVDVFKQVEFDSAYIFKYSERPNTLASKRFPDDVTEAQKTSRIILLNELQLNTSLKKNIAHIGETHHVILERQGTKKDPKAWQGRNDGNKIVIVENGKYSIGDEITVKITAGSVNALSGHPL